MGAVKAVTRDRRTKGSCRAIYRPRFSVPLKIAETSAMARFFMITKDL
jgi:hypothetical protein